MPNIQISKELFIELLKYFSEIPLTDENESIIKQLSAKLDKMIAHDIFTKYKRAVTPEEREYYRKRYLKEVNISKDFISENEIHFRNN